MANQPPAHSSPSFPLFPRRKIRSYDGMAITAEVWEQAHTYHDQALRAHTRNLHGWGIVSGLEVVASDPPDRIIFILPGAAIDPTGQVIVLPEPVAYDIGNDMEGPLYLFISHRESSSGSMKEDSSPVYGDDQFLITATPVLSEQPAVELARFVCESRSSHLLDAQAPLCPTGNEIDLRYRVSLEAQSIHIVTAGTAYLGEGSRGSQGNGLARISPELRHSMKLQLVVDDDIQLGPNVVRYDLLYLVGQGAFKVNPNLIRGLQGYLQRGGMLFLESYDAESAVAMLDFCGQLGVGLNKISSSHPILSNPHLFYAPPQGNLPGGEVMIGQYQDELIQVVYSTMGYGTLWAGECQSGEKYPPSREQLRAAIEFAGNLLSNGLDHQIAL